MLYTVPKLMTFEVEFEFWEKLRSHTDSDQASMLVAEPLKYVFGQKIVHGDGSVTGSIVVMQHRSVRNLWPDTMCLSRGRFSDSNSTHY